MRDDFSAELARKRFSTLQARCALAGWALAEIVDAGRSHYVAVRWGRSRELPNLEAVENFLRQVEGGTCAKG